METCANGQLAQARCATPAAAKLGDDADTTAAITRQLASALYRVEAISKDWRHVLHLCGEIQDLARRLYGASRTRQDLCSSIRGRGPSQSGAGVMR